MEFIEIIQRFHEIQAMYSEMDKKGRDTEWPRQEYVRAFTADVGALAKLTMAKDGFREVENVDEKLRHELADCFYGILVIAEKYGINLEEAFLEGMNELEERAKRGELGKSHSL